MLKKYENSTKEFYKCPACGCLANRRGFTLGALGQHSLVQRERIIEKGVKGMRWTRRPMLRAEVEHVAKAAAAAAQHLETRLDGELPLAAEASQVLSQIEDDEEVRAVILDWIADAEKELEERRAIGIEELNRRFGTSKRSHFV